MSHVEIHDDRACALGEGPIWHPLRKQLFWFDILDKQLMCDNGDVWQFGEKISAGGWIDETRFLIASETRLFTFDIITRAEIDLTPLEADNPQTRSNDGRTDPWGAFWISTMGKQAEDCAGAIYRFHNGVLHQVFGAVTIPNAICFMPDKSAMFYTDTAVGHIIKAALDKDGWPTGKSQIFLDFHDETFGPDGAIITADGLFVIAQWGASRIAIYNRNAKLIDTVALPTEHITCPALGDGKLFATSAKQGLPGDKLRAQRHAGKTFVVPSNLKPQAEYQVIL